MQDKITVDEKGNVGTQIDMSHMEATPSHEEGYTCPNCNEVLDEVGYTTKGYVDCFHVRYEPEEIEYQCPKCNAKIDQIEFEEWLDG